MRAHGWLGLCFAFAVTTAAFSSCKHSVESGTGGAGASGTGGTGGAGGATSSSSSSGMPEAGPIICTSQYSTVPTGSCDLLQQDCPPGETCVPERVGSSYTTYCAGGTGLKTAGETCYAAGDCDAKLFCFANKCTSVCCRGSNEPCDGVQCSLSVPFGDYFMYVCHYAVSCELLTPNACPIGSGCHVEDPTQGLATCSQPSGADSPELGPCKYLNDCGDNQQCFEGNGSTGTCHWYCYLMGSSNEQPGVGGCPMGETCVGSHDGASTGVGIPGVGLCFPSGTPTPDAGGGDGGDTDGGEDGGGAGGG